MKLTLIHQRKDGKVKVRYSYDTGRSLDKIITWERYEEDRKRSRDLSPHPTPFDRR